MPENPDELQALTEYLEQDAYTGRFQEFERDQRWYDGSVDIEKLLPSLSRPHEIDPVVLPLAQTYINGFTDHMVNSNRRIVADVDPRMVEKSGETEATHFSTMRGELLSMFHRRVNRVHEDIRPDRNVAKFLGLRGMACKELLFSQERHDERGFGFTIEAHDPWTLLPDPSLRDKQFVIRKYQTTLGSAKRFMGPKADRALAKLSESRRDWDLVDVTRYCDKDAWYTMIGDDWVEEDNNFGFLPYVFAYNGLGLSTDRARETVDVHAVQSRSLLFGIRNILEHAVRMDTSIWEAMRWGIWPIALGINLDNDGEDDNTIDIRPGNLVPIRREGADTDEDIEFRSKPPMDANIWHGLNRHQAWMDRAAGSGVLQGSTDRAQSSALEFEQRLAQARLMFGEAMESVTSMDHFLGERVQEFLEKKNLTVTVAFQRPESIREGSRSFAGKDLNGFYDHEIEMLAPGQDKIEFNQLITKIQVAQTPGPGPTMEWALANQDGIDPHAMLRKKRKELAAFSPQVQTVFAEFAASELGIAMGEAKQEAEAQDAIPGFVDAAEAGFAAGENQSTNAENVRRRLQSTVAQGQPGGDNTGRPTLGPNTGANGNG